jgi:hypothetical protein
MVMFKVKELNNVLEKAETTDDRSRLTEISKITCKITVRDERDKIVFTKKFPLPKKTRRAMGLIRSYLDFYEEIEGSKNFARYEFEFYNIPPDVMDFIKKKFNQWTLLKGMFTEKLPPIGLPFIIRCLKRAYGDKCVIRLNGEES